MKIFGSADEFKPSSEYLAVAMGNFDGLHLAHRELLARAKAGADEHGGKLLMLTFWPHPMSIIGEGAPPLLCSREEKHRLAAELGVDYLLELPFNRDLAALRPEDFVQDILHDRLRANMLAVGFNFHFGARGMGNAASLKSLDRLFDMQTLVLPSYEIDGEPVSSSHIRSLLAAGQMRAANRLLGRCFALCGRVIHGKQLGKKLGFATANMAAVKGLCLPAYGVYAAWATVGGKQHPAVVNIGVQPTVGDFAAPTIETHLLDVEDIDIYGADMQVQFVAEIRREQKFAGLDELAAQIAADKLAAQKILL